MPRISADSVAEHVAHQEAAVFDVAIALFCERGYTQVTLGDIAAGVGLARNSLYRYFPDKAHILLRWYRIELPNQTEHSRGVLTGEGTPAERIQRWAIDQLDYASRPEHQLIASFAEIAPQLDADTRAELADSHSQLLAPLIETLADAGVSNTAQRNAIGDLIGGLVLSVARREGITGPDQAARSCLSAAITGMLEESIGNN